MAPDRPVAITQARRPAYKRFDRYEAPGWIGTTSAGEEEEYSIAECRTRFGFVPEYGTAVPLSYVAGEPIRAK